MEGWKCNRPGKTIRKFLRKGRLARGAAAKLQFVAGHFAGRHGRAFLARFAERQQSSSKDCTLSRSLDGAARSWLHILASDLRPHSLCAPVVPETADVVLFTDGACPDAREWLRDTTLLAWVAFWKNYRGAKERVFFHSWVVTLEAVVGVGGQANPGIHGRAPCHRVCVTKGTRKAGDVAC